MNKDKNKSVTIFDTTLRDGEQGAGSSMSHDDKVMIALALEAAGVDVIEAGFPASSAGSLAVVQAIATKTQQSIVCALARCLESDIDAATLALLPAGARSRMHVFVATNNDHLRDKLRMTEREVLASIAHHVAYARVQVADVEFSPEVATTTGRAFLFQSIEIALQAGATTINIPDTTGYSLPHEYGELIAAVVKQYSQRHPAVTISVHCHNDRGLATANALSGIKAGARQVECTVNGIGERAGNTALEEVLMALTLRPDYYRITHAVDTSKLCQLSALVAGASGVAVAVNKAFVGENAFAHESGIHQAATLKNPALYEICSPDLVGAKRRLPIGKLSGRAGLENAIAGLGVMIPTAVFERVYQAVTIMGDTSKVVSAKDIQQIINRVQSE